MEGQEVEKIGMLILSDSSKVKNAIAQCCVLIGIRPDNMPGNFEMEVILRYLNENQRNWTPEEMVEAFTKFIDGALDIPKEHQHHYQEFSPALISQVMNAYRYYLVCNKPKPKQLAVKSQMHPDDEYKFFVEACINAFEAFKKGDNVLDFGNVKYKFLDGLKHINLTPKQKQVIWEESSNIVRARLEADSLTPDFSERRKIKNMIESFDDNENVEDEIRKIARYRGLMEYFQSLVDNKIEIKDLL